MCSEDEYTHRQFWLPTTKWTEIGRSPSPHTYKYTGQVKSEIKWFSLEPNDLGVRKLNDIMKSYEKTDKNNKNRD